MLDVLDRRSSVEASSRWSAISAHAAQFVLDSLMFCTRLGNRTQDLVEKDAREHEFQNDPMQLPQSGTLVRVDCIGIMSYQVRQSALIGMPSIYLSRGLIY